MRWLSLVLLAGLVSIAVLAQDSAGPEVREPSAIVAARPDADADAGAGTGTGTGTGTQAAPPQQQTGIGQGQTIGTPQTIGPAPPGGADGGTGGAGDAGVPSQPSAPPLPADGGTGGTGDAGVPSQPSAPPLQSAPPPQADGGISAAQLQQQLESLQSQVTQHSQELSTTTERSLQAQVEVKGQSNEERIEALQTAINSLVDLQEALLSGASDVSTELQSAESALARAGGGTATGTWGSATESRQVLTAQQALAEIPQLLQTRNYEQAKLVVWSALVRATDALTQARSAARTSQ